MNNENDFLFYNINWFYIILKTLGITIGIFFIVLAILDTSTLGFFIIYLILGLGIIVIAIVSLYDDWQKYDLHKKLRDYFEQEDLDKLMDLVEEDSLEYKAIHAISDLKTAKSREKLLEILFNYEDYDIRDAALTELEQTDDPEVISRIEEFLDSKDAKDDELYFEIALAHVSLSPGGKGEEILKQMNAEEKLDEKQKDDFLFTLGLNSLESISEHSDESLYSNKLGSELSSLKDSINSFESQESFYQMIISLVNTLQKEINDLQEQIKYMQQFQKEPLSNEELIKRLRIKSHYSNDSKEIEELTNSIKNLREPPPPPKKKFFEKEEVGKFILGIVSCALTLAITLGIQKLLGII